MLMYETGGNFKRPDLITGAPTVSVQLGKENWERIFLGAIYVLGSFHPDTLVRARDAMILADAALYPSDPTDPDSPGIHRAVIERAYAAREIGFNAEAPVGGRQVISTRVSNFTGSQGRLSAPRKVTVALTSPTSAQVSAPGQRRFCLRSPETRDWPRESASKSPGLRSRIHRR
jgi:hypothetical protein